MFERIFPGNELNAFINHFRLDANSNSIDSEILIEFLKMKRKETSQDSY